MSRALAVSVAIVLLCLSGIAQADVFNLGPGLTNLETVLVGDPGNAADTRYASPGYGSVGYTYNIGRYEVTAGQYADFLNNKANVSDPYGLYNASMWSSSAGCKIQQNSTAGNYFYSVASDWANRPVNYVSFWDSLRFANWLNNGQGDGDTETGAYTLNGYNDTDGRTIQRNAESTWFLTSEDEWYKAAYYKGGGTNAGYWDYPMQSDIPTTPSNDVVSPTDPGNNANFYQSGYTIGSPYYRTNVGEFENSESAYGTFDQGGNVWEWNEALVSGASRGLRGGSYYHTSLYLPAAYRSYYKDPTTENYSSGFRVAFVPEPAGLLALSCGLIGLIGMGMRKRR